MGSGRLEKFRWSKCGQQSKFGVPGNTKDAKRKRPLGFSALPRTLRRILNKAQLDPSGPSCSAIYYEVLPKGEIFPTSVFLEHTTEKPLSEYN
ncbi:uncharacterized protein LOC144242666 isoform X2 [Crocuta crocuta]